MSSFTKIKKALVGHDKSALLSLVGELYALNSQNRDFLDARFVADESALERYKRQIRYALYPELHSSVSFRDAKKAISDYKKAIGKDAGIAELLVYACESGTDFTCEFGDIDAPFYDALIRMFVSAVKVVQGLEPDIAKYFIGRLAKVVEEAKGIGWGYYDCIAEIFDQEFYSEPEA